MRTLLCLIVLTACLTGCGATTLTTPPSYTVQPSTLTPGEWGVFLGGTEQTSWATLEDAQTELNRLLNQ